MIMTRQNCSFHWNISSQNEFRHGTVTGNLFILFVWWKKSVGWYEGVEAQVRFINRMTWKREVFQHLYIYIYRPNIISEITFDGLRASPYSPFFGTWNQLLHPRKLTWNLKMMVFNRNLFQGVIFRFHVSFRECTSPKQGSKKSRFRIDPPGASIITTERNVRKVQGTSASVIRSPHLRCFGFWMKNTFLSGWWLNQPIWKIFVKNGFIFPKFRDEHKKSLSCHHLALFFHDWAEWKLKKKSSITTKRSRGTGKVFLPTAPLNAANLQLHLDMHAWRLPVQKRFFGGKEHDRFTKAES